MIAGGMLCACSDNSGDNNNRPEAGNTVNFALGSMPNRTVFDQNNKYQINWQDGDKVRIFCDEAEDVKQADYNVREIDDSKKNNAKLEYNENGLAWGSDDATHNFYAVYPADNNKVSVSNGIATFKINYNQTCTVQGTADANGHYTTTPDMTNAYMVAKLSTKPIDQVTLNFAPIMTTLEITVKGRETANTGAVTITGVSIISNNVNYTNDGVFYYDIAKGTMAESGANDATTTSTTTNSTTIFVGVKNNDDSFVDIEPGQSITFTVFLPPVAIGADNPVDVRVHATGDVEQTVTIKGQNDANGNPMEFAASSKGAITLANFPTETVASGNNWITPLDDNIYVSQLSIPGTHDAATGDGTDYSIGKTQELTLDQQFEKGIRAFDLRPAYQDGAMNIYHGIVSTTFEWGQVMERFKYYLSKAPGEFIIVIMRHEEDSYSAISGASDSQKEAWQNAMSERMESIKNDINPTTKESYVVDFRPDLTIGEMRGKILFLCREWTKYNNDGPIVGGYMGWSHSKDGAEVSIYGPSGSAGTLNIQDCYAPSESGDWGGLITGSLINNSTNKPLVQNFPTVKWNAIENLLKKSMEFHKQANLINRWSINHTSGYVGGRTAGIYHSTSTTDGYRENAANNNIKLYNMLQSVDWTGSTGIILSDFVGARTSGNYTVYGDLLPQTIIDNNYKYRMKRKGE